MCDTWTDCDIWIFSVPSYFCNLVTMRNTSLVLTLTFVAQWQILQKYIQKVNISFKPEECKCVKPPVILLVSMG